jgi:hypothetical protein
MTMMRGVRVLDGDCLACSPSYIVEEEGEITARRDERLEIGDEREVINQMFVILTQFFIV